jgi:site-specific DNA-methyltransferase (cytosine-N4-specific)
MNHLNGYKSSDNERIRLENKYSRLLEEDLSLGRYVSYVGNRNVPLLGLFRFKEAFAFEFVRDVLKRLEVTASDFVFDPFAGMGTTMFTSMIHGIPSVGIDKLPLAAFIAETIPKFLTVKKGEIENTYHRLLQKVQRAELACIAMDVPLMALAFNKGTLKRLRQWKSIIDELKSPIKEIFQLLFLSILEDTSYTAKDGQFLRLRKDKQTESPEKALKRKVRQAELDIERINWLLPSTWNGFLPKIFTADTRDLSQVCFSKKPTVLITSPPYVNRYDYTRSYCLELCFNFVKSFEELKAVRFAILRSHIECKVSKEEQPNHPVIDEVVSLLRTKKLNNPKIPSMIIAYFIDMKQTIREWGRVLSDDAKVAMVVDNVRFEGELVPVDLVLTDMAEEEGFKPEKVLISRYKGNSSQQMGKYGRVPVRESIVIWRKH